MSRLLATMLVAAALCLLPGVARAHISVISGPAFADTTQEVVFGVAHGCAGADTYRVRIEIPSSITSIRPERSDFGAISVEKDATNAVTAVVWQKADADVLDADIAYYKLVVRLKLPKQPFSTVYFLAHQTCRAMDGTMSTTDWTALPSDPPSDAASTDEPAPALIVMPPHLPGWNKFTIASPVADLGPVFGDAQIVWKGATAYSANPTTADLINATAGVSALSALAANDEIWVKY